jgi:hypothetical protein
MNQETTYERPHNVAPITIAGDRNLSAAEAAWQYLRQYAREYPESIALCAFGLGFVMGWRLKPW